MNIMSTEQQQIALRFKGEDYKECKEQLHEEGFVYEGYNQWRSPLTGVIFRFVLAEQGGYVTRVEWVSDDGPQTIDTEFTDRKEALARYEAEHARPTDKGLNGCIERFKDAQLRTSMSKVIRLIERGRDDGDPDATALFRYICTPGSDKLVIRNYLFCDGVVCFYSSTRRTTHTLVHVIAHNGKKLYLYQARYYLEDLLESLVSKVRLSEIIGEEAVKDISEANA